MNKRNLILGVFVFCSLVIFSLAVTRAEEVTITTYYPSPNGVYQDLVTQVFGVGDNNADGKITSLDSPDPLTNAGDVWIAGSVGISTITPACELDVNGTANAVSYSVGGTAGYNGTITVGDGVGGTCQIVVTNGIITSTTCP